MAQFIFQMIDNKVGMNLVTFDLSEDETRRIYEAFQHRMRIPFDPELEDPTPIPTPKEVLRNLSDNLFKFVVENVYEIEKEIGLARLNIKRIGEAEK